MAQKRMRFRYFRLAGTRDDAGKTNLKNICPRAHRGRFQSLRLRDVVTQSASNHIRQDPLSDRCECLAKVKEAFENRVDA